MRVLGDTHRALAAGRIDLDRATVLAAATEVLADTAAREVEARMLAGAGDSAWAGPSPRAWRTRVDRAVTGVDPDAARRRRQEAVADRAVRAFGLGDGTGLLQIRVADTTIAVADQVITDLAHRWPTVGPDGTVLSMDQRRVDAVMDLFHRARDGRELPTVAVRREREIGLVLHTDTLLGDGPAASDPGELRGLGAPVPVDPTTARELARQDIARGTAVQVLLADHGVLRRVVRLRHAQPGGCTRAALITAVRDRLGELSPLVRDRHDPTVAIAEHVRARNPLCTSYDCPRTAQRCDLDHDTPWPRGPTDAANLCPRCRRHHELKTRRLVRTRLQSDGTVVTTMLTGIQATTRPEPLPGHDVGEGYGPAA